MSVYFIAFIHELTDPNGMAEYSIRAVPTVQQFNGTQIAASLAEHAQQGPFADAMMPPIETIEGKPVAGVSVIKFPDRASFDTWYNSPEYRSALPFRLAASNVQAIVVEDIPS